MSELMRPLAFSDLVRWIQTEARNSNSVFGIRKEKFYRNSSSAGITLFGTKIASPLGPAAGPHTQLTQNILAAYLAGSRFIELKTVQTMDGEELRKCVARPCINAADEGYNVEWSTELTVQEAFEEYIKAWFLAHVVAKEFALEDPCGLIFNMSVGYSLEGIQSPKIDTYIEGMRNASGSPIWKICYDYLAANIHSFERFTQKDLEAIPSAVSSSITLSTLHGCPKEEIEKIASYLLTVKGMHTYVKCNPTLLGYETARRLLDDMGYGYISFDDHHFKNDLQFGDAVAMLRRLQVQAQEKGLAFGVKITNTFPVAITKGELPGEEMYMSGRSLFPLSITVAQRLTQEFNGTLSISYSGGADFFNLASILETGIRPVTMATNLLKPGGYERLKQLAELAEAVLPRLDPGLTTIQVQTLNTLAEQLTAQKRHRKEHRQGGLRKTASVLPLFDCAQAPCQEGGCPLHQQIPGYLEKVAAGEYGAAFEIIAQDNAAPSITGTICDHRCQQICTRVDYDNSLEIRQAKRIAAEHAQDAYSSSLKPIPLKTDRSVGIIGAGPAGIGAAVYLRRNGVPVRVYEKRPTPYGIVGHVIPSFRISQEAIDRDFRLAVKLGVEFTFGVDEGYSLDRLKKDHAFVVLATGAWKAGSSSCSGAEEFLDALQFLEAFKASGGSLDLGKQVAVIGGGDVAMDCARAAKRNPGVETVSIVYRRTKDFMPAQQEELEGALADGVRIIELCAPESFKAGILRCEVMHLGAYDKSGRRSIVGTGTYVDLSFDRVISAVGAQVDTTLFTQNSIGLNDKGFPALNTALESSVQDVYVAGDCKAGAATVVKALADSKTIAQDILQKLRIPADFGVVKPQPDKETLYARKGVAAPSLPGNTDAYRCLSCGEICEICCDVCPNRANVMVNPASSLSAGGHQVVHIDRLCNECGNCAVFCPHQGAPYQDKFTVFSCEEDFTHSTNTGFWSLGNGSFKVRLADKSVLTWHGEPERIPQEVAQMIDLLMQKYRYMVTEV
ncbi:MAG: putative selenate reductase subunit YgfK [Treponema sp.]|nr:putative selenate reductase subunit YgfK [Treponema sp.]